MSQQTVLTADEKKLNDPWEEHLRTEFKRTAPTTLSAMLRDQIKG